MNSYIIQYILTATRGGENRTKILQLLHKTPLNAHQLKESIQVDYKTIQHHLRLLVKHQFIHAPEGKYGAMYYLTDEFKGHADLFGQILAKFNKSIKAG